MKKLIILLSVAFCITANAQKVYFSNTPFKPGVEPSESKSSFTDDEFIYGLAIYDKTLSELDISSEKYLSANGDSYLAGTVRVGLQASLLGNMGYQSAAAIEKDGKTFVLIHILPNPEEVFYIRSYPDGIRDMYTVPLLSKKFKFFVKAEGREVSFTKSFKMEKKGNFNEDKVDELSKVIYDIPTYDEDLKRGSAASEQDEVTYDVVEVKFTNEYLSPGDDLGLKFRYKKKGQEFCDWTRGYKGFDISGEGIQNSDTWRVKNLPFGISGSDIKVIVTNSYNSNCKAEISAKVDFGGQHQINLSGSVGRAGRSGKRSSFGSTPTNGQDGSNGKDAGTVDIFVTKYSEGLYLVKCSSSLYNDVYEIVSTEGKLHVKNNGGTGGNGGGGGHGDPSKGISDATAGNGGNGGDGGPITFHIDPSAKSFKENLTYENHGGGRGGWIYHGEHGNYGYNGKAGPEAQFKIEKVDISLPAK